MRGDGCALCVMESGRQFRGSWYVFITAIVIVFIYSYHLEITHRIMSKITFSHVPVK